MPFAAEYLALFGKGKPDGAMGSAHPAPKTPCGRWRMRVPSSPDAQMPAPCSPPNVPPQTCSTQAQPSAM